MSITTVRVVFTDESRWAVESDGEIGGRVIYACRGAAIAAGVHKAMANDALLMIHGVEDRLSEIDFRDGVLQLN